MKRYTLQMLIHDARVFNQLRMEYRRDKKNRRGAAAGAWFSRYLPGMRRRARVREDGLCRCFVIRIVQTRCGTVRGERECFSVQGQQYGADGVHNSTHASLW